MRLSLGTAQFGLDYGVTNASGKVPAPTVNALLELAKSRGILQLDTAAAYGDAEAVLSASNMGCNDFEITTKIPSLAGLTPPQALSRIEDSVCNSIELLGPALKCILFHDAQDLMSPQTPLYWQQAEDVAEKYGIRCVGVSVYSEDDIDAVFARVTPQVVQLPINVLDQRLLVSGALERLKQAGVETQARSVFLQGTLLTAPERLPKPLARLRTQVQDLQDVAKANGLSVIDMCLGFLRVTGLLDTAVVGVTSNEELNQICNAMERQVSAIPYQNFRVSDPMLVDPRFWSNTQVRRQSQ